MAQGVKGKLNYRCSRCLMREIDVDMLYDKEKYEYYYIRCSFVGNKDDVRRINQQFREKYIDRIRRITDF